jgi:hypothetical protein
MPERYIWIPRWEDFQHYAPARERGPAWIKTHTAQLSDDRYLRLSSKSRSVLHDLRMLFATMRQRVPNDSRTLSGLLGQRVTNVTLESLRDAGLIEFISRDVLEERIESLLASRTPAHSRRSKEVEEDKEPPQTPPQTRRGSGQSLTKKELRRYTGCRRTRGTHGTGWKRDPLGIDRPPPDWPHPEPTLEEVLAAQAQLAGVAAEPDDDDIGF